MDYEISVLNLKQSRADSQGTHFLFSHRGVEGSLQSSFLRHSTHPVLGSQAL